MDSMSENRARSLRGELYYAFTTEMEGLRKRCGRAVHAFNTAGDITRRERVELWRVIVNDTTPSPQASESESYPAYPWIEPPIRCDYGTNISIGPDVFINFNCTILDTCQVSIGARTLIGPSVSLYAATHPLDPEVRNGTAGPESGKEIIIEEDCWLAGSVTVLPGVRIGTGSTVGAGSVVTKDVPPYSVVAGNPAKVIKSAPRGTNAEVTSGALAVLRRDQAAEMLKISQGKADSA